MKALTFMFLCVTWLCEPLLAQYNIASSSLRASTNTNASRKKVKNQTPANQDKSALKMGTRVCVPLNGKPTEAMVTGSAPVYGSNKDSYQVSVTEEGANYRKQIFLRPNEISSVGECPVEYLPKPVKEISASLDVRQLENDIIKEVNILRANPKAYAEEMAKLKFEMFEYSHNRTQYVALGNGDYSWVCSEKDQKCVSDFNKKFQVAINFLRNFNKKLDPLTENSQLAKASEMLAADPGKIDGPGHKDSKGRGAAERSKLAGYSGYRGEVLYGGHTTAAGYIIGYLTSPGHRDILLKDGINEIGVDVHKHGSGEQAFLRNVINVGYSANVTPTQNSVAATPQSPAASSTATLKNQTGMKPGDKLLEGQKLVSANGIFQLRGTADGNFVVEDIQSGAVLYTFPLAGPINNPPAVSFLSYNPDGNICIESKQNKGYCATNGRDGVAPVILNKSERAIVTNDGRFALLNKQGQEIWSTKSRHIITKWGYVLATVNNPSAQAHIINLGNEMFIAPHKQEKPHHHLVQGYTYDIFAVGIGGDRSGPQSHITFIPDPDRAAWVNALKNAGILKVISVSNTAIHPNNAYTLSAQQSVPNGPIQLTWEVYNEVDGKRQQLLSTFTAETKPMKWPF